MTRFITTLLLTATLVPAAAFAQDTRDDDRGDRDSYLEEVVFDGGGLAPTPREPQAHPNDVLPEDLIDEICEDADVIIIFGDDGEITDWDCDFN